DAGMKAGDRITAWNGTPVWTFGDVQYGYDQVDRRAKTLKIAVDRNGQPVDLNVTLPERWWLTDLRFRQSSVDPRLGFEDRLLNRNARRKLGLNPDGFASQVKYISETARMMKSHDLRVGDVIYAVDGVERDDLANTVELYIKLRKKAGSQVMLKVMRNGQ